MKPMFLIFILSLSLICFPVLGVEKNHQKEDASGQAENSIDLKKVQKNAELLYPRYQ